MSDDPVTLSLPPRQHQKLLADSPRGPDPSDVEYCAGCWKVVDADACAECGSTERYVFDRGDE